MSSSSSNGNEEMVIVILLVLKELNNRLYCIIVWWSNYKKKKGVKKDVVVWNIFLGEGGVEFLVWDSLLLFEGNCVVNLFESELFIGSEFFFIVVLEFEEVMVVGLFREDVFIFGLLDILVLVIFVFVLFFYYYFLKGVCRKWKKYLLLLIGMGNEVLEM